MFGSTVLEVAIGLTFCYGTLALVVSTFQEALAAAFSLRANMLLDAVKRMLDDPRCEALAQSLYDHPLVNPHGTEVNGHGLELSRYGAMLVAGSAAGFRGVLRDAPGFGTGPLEHEAATT